MAETVMARPRLRPLELKWLDDTEPPTLFMRDPSGIAPYPATVPAWVALLLGFFNGERDAAGIAAAFELRTGRRIPASQIEQVIGELDAALFLDSPRYQAAREVLVREYRAAAFRPPSHAGKVYPESPTELARALDGFKRREPATPMGAVRGIVSPHIDYHRGGPIYAETWGLAVEAVQQAEVVVIFGTDHAGGGGTLTLTTQSYASPYGILPTSAPIVDAVAAAIGMDAAFDEELHHLNEHSIELAAVWLQHVRIGPPPEIVPILCGSFHPFTEGEGDPAAHETFDRALDALKRATEGRRVLAVAAADLAHVGPAFGDPRPYSPDDKQSLRAKDDELLCAVCSGDPSEFFNLLRAERDCRRICGLPPIYLLLRFLGESTGQVIAYDQCPADADFGSIVSVAGVLLS